jgi:lysophospholipase L1-like esterase
VRPYDLIIIHFGLNVANNKQKNYSGYTKRMSTAIQHIRRHNPNASILVIGVGDREERDVSGNMHTMTGIRELISYQRKMAADNKVAFWNLYEAMGGDGSLALMVTHKQANLDYTHINFAGGRKLAKILYDVFINGKENYDKRK